MEHIKFEVRVLCGHADELVAATLTRSSDSDSARTVWFLNSFPCFNTEIIYDITYYSFALPVERFLNLLHVAGQSVMSTVKLECNAGAMAV
jgi:hypothetical protein